MTIGNALDQAREILSGAFGDDSSSEAIAILAHVLDKSPLVIIAEADEIRRAEFSSEEEKKFFEYVRRRAKSEPKQYIEGKAYFYREEYFVGPGVLIPRPDTEILVETSFNLLLDKLRLEGKNTCKVVDLCTGTGCVGISLANELSRKGIIYDLILVDISDEAINYANKNVASCLKLMPDCKVRVVKADVLQDELSNITPSCDIIVSNPPYVTSKEMEELDDSVREFEPRLALYGGRDDGMLFYDVITRKALQVLGVRGILAFEHGYLQGDATRRVLSDAGLDKVSTLKDFGGNDRVTYGIIRE